MDINDPFGRMKRRHQTGYEALRGSLTRSNIDTEEGARKIIRDTKVRALKFVIGAAAVLLMTYLFLPGLLVGVGAITILASTWVFIWTINGERYVNRYIEEELSGSGPGSDKGGAP